VEIQIGKIPFRYVGDIGANKRPISYAQVPRDKMGWVIDPIWKPILFDLVALKVTGRKNPINGWWDGKKWVSIRLLKEYVVTAWKHTG
jgi:hypothetical protein